MPDESCRKCGGTLVNCTQCAVCKEIIGMICQNCGARAMEQFHDYCVFGVSNIHTRDFEEDQESVYAKITAFA